VSSAQGAGGARSDNARLRRYGPWVLASIAILAVVIVADIHGVSSRDSLPHKVEVTTQAGPYHLTLTAVPGGPGANMFTLKVGFKSRGSRRIASVHIVETMITMAMTPQYISLRRVSSGLYRGQGQLAMAGVWEFQILISPSGSGHTITAVGRGRIGG